VSLGVAYIEQEGKKSDHHNLACYGILSLCLTQNGKSVQWRDDDDDDDDDDAQESRASQPASLPQAEHVLQQQQQQT
jgi:hypothetical protein